MGTTPRRSRGGGGGHRTARADRAPLARADRARLVRTDGRPLARARLLAAALVCLAACDTLSDPGVVARAGDWTLTEQRLAELLVLAQPYPLDSLAVDQLADLWVSAAALSQRAAAGDSLLGSEARAESTWLDQREALLEADRRQRLGEDAAREAGSPEEVFREGSLRLIAHSLRRVGPETSSSERLLQQRTAERLLGIIADGGGWDQVVAETEDADSRQRGGLLGLFAAGELPSTLDRAAFRLQPGQVSGVTQSAQGFHILYRPRFEEVETLFADLLLERMLAQADAGAAEGVRTARNFSVTPGATVVIGRMAEGPAQWLDSNQVLATWEDGTLTAAIVARVLLFFPPESLAELAQVGDAERLSLINDIGTRELRLADALARGLALDAPVAERLSLLHDEEIEYWTGALELESADSPSRDALGRYMERVASRREEARSLPPLLDAWLLARTDTRVRARGVLAAIVLARGMLAEAGRTGQARSGAAAPTAP